MTNKLQGDKVLVAGGDECQALMVCRSPTSTALLLDPAVPQGGWVPTGEMIAPRSGHSAALLTAPSCATTDPPAYCGDVLVAGGGQGLPFAEMFDLSSRSWQRTNPMAEQVTTGSVLVLLDGDPCRNAPVPPHCGKVLLLTSSSTQLFDPAWVDPTTGLRGQWTKKASSPFRAAGTIISPASFFTATLLKDGRVLVVGGSDRQTAAEIFDPTSDPPWSLAGAMFEPRVDHSSTALSDGKVLVIGGRLSPTTSELFVPGVPGVSGDRWDLGPQTSVGRVKHSAVRLNNGDVLITGGLDQANFQAVRPYDFYESSAKRWACAPWEPPPPDQPPAYLCPEPPNTARWDHHTVGFADGKVLLVGGLADSDVPPCMDCVGGTPVASTDIYSPAAIPLPPSILRLEPARGSSLGGTKVRIFGTNLSGATRVHFGEAAAPTTAISENEIEVRAPAHAPGPVSVRASNGGIVPSAAVPFIYLPESGGVWSIAKELFQQPGTFGHTTTALPSGKVLVAGGYTGDFESAPELFDPTYFDPATGRHGKWTRTGHFNVVMRLFHSATLLTDGRVLVAGGSTELVDLQGARSAEIYNPASGTWTLTAPMMSDRFHHTATLLTGPACLPAGAPSYCGKVLVVGGGPFNQGNPTAELFDPASGLWTPAGVLSEGRVHHTATLLSDGKVLVAGGARNALGPTTASAELYDPASGIWSQVGLMAKARANHTANLRPDGKVLVAGGDEGTAQSAIRSAETFDPASGTWSPADPLLSARNNHSSVTLPNGKVLIAGGLQGTEALTSSEIYDHATGLWAPGPSMNIGRHQFAMAVLQGTAEGCGVLCGRVLATAGYGQNGKLRSTEIFAATPQVAGLSPNRGPAKGGTVIRLTGTGFAGTTSVKFGAREASAFQPDPQQPDSILRVRTPGGPPGPAEVVVTSPGGSSAGGPSSTFVYEVTAGGQGEQDDGLSSGRGNLIEEGLVSEITTIIFGRGSPLQGRAASDRSGIPRRSKGASGDHSSDVLVPETAKPRPVIELRSERPAGPKRRQVPGRIDVIEKASLPAAVAVGSFVVLFLAGGAASYFWVRRRTATGIRRFPASPK